MAVSGGEGRPGMTTNEEIALTLTAVLMTGRRASDANADRAVALFRHILDRLADTDRTVPPPSPTDYRT